MTENVIIRYVVARAGWRADGWCVREVHKGFGGREVAGTVVSETFKTNREARAEAERLNKENSNA